MDIVYSGKNVVNAPVQIQGSGVLFDLFSI